MQGAAANWLSDFKGSLEAKYVAEGVSWRWRTSDPSLESGFEKIHLANYDVERDAKQAKIAREEISKEVAKLLSDGRVRDVSHLRNDPYEALMILPIFAVFQGEKVRVVWDARELNQHIDCPHFKMESVSTAAKLLRPNDYMFTVSSRGTERQDRNIYM